MSPRFRLAAESGALPCAPDASVLVIGPAYGLDLAAFGAVRPEIVQDMMPDAAKWAQAGYTVHAAVPARVFDAVLVCLPRAKEAARDRIAQAMAASRGTVLIDGAKTDGSESLLKDMRRKADILGVVSKAHGKLFWCTPSAAFEDWRAVPSLIEDRWHTVPGVFSAGRVDAGSALLSAHLPASLSGVVADLGAGWGYLAGSVLERCPAVSHLHLVEAQGAALECARRNVTDSRGVFHWADATTWAGIAGVDAVVMNPPFHMGRAAEPDLGRAFIANAARLLRPGGRLYMVANRHLPYEATLRDSFAEVAEIGGTSKFKLLSAKLKSRVKR